MNPFGLIIVALGVLLVFAGGKRIFGGTGSNTNASSMTKNPVGTTYTSQQGGLQGTGGVKTKKVGQGKFQVQS